MDNLPFDPKKFRLSFPEFADPAIWDDALLLQKWVDGGHFLIQGKRLSGEAYAYARNLLAAHLLILGQKAKDTTSGNGVLGLVSSASVDKISVSLAPPPIKNSWHYWLSQTPRGQELLALLKKFSAGGLFVGGTPPERDAFRKSGGVFISGKSHS